MTLVQLMNELGEQIESVKAVSMDQDSQERGLVLTKADQISRIAKQMINGADVILRTDKLIAEGKLQNATIRQVVGIEG